MNNFNSFWTTIIKSAKNYSKLKAKAVFLQNCQKAKIIPHTLIFKPPNKNSNFKNSKSYRNVAKNASMQNVNIATNDAKRIAKEAQMNHHYLLENLMKNFN